jgi:hypothetical protein
MIPANMVSHCPHCGGDPCHCEDDLYDDDDWSDSPDYDEDPDYDPDWTEFGEGEQEVMT